MKRIIVEMNIALALLIAVGVIVAWASYEDGLPDWSSVHHGDWNWANHAEVTGWYGAPMLYTQEDHWAFCWANLGNTVLSSNITFRANYGNQIVYEENWFKYDTQDISKSYYNAATAAHTTSDTWFMNQATGNRWRDRIVATVVAGSGPG